MRYTNAGRRPKNAARTALQLSHRGSGSLTDSLTNRRVLLVHRLPLIRLAVEVIANEAGFEICGECESVPQARELFWQYKPQLVVVGLSLVGGDGLELVKDFRNYDPPARCIVLTSRDDVLSLRRAFKAGARGYVSIRDDITEVSDALQRVATGEVHASRHVHHLLLLDAGIKSTHLNEQMRSLSDRESQVLRLIGLGFRASGLARELGISVKTVETHQGRVKQKLGLRSAADLKQTACRWIRESDGLFATTGARILNNAEPRR